MPFTLEMARSALVKFDAVVEKQKTYLTDLDSAIGDADHGINMSRGMKRVIEKTAPKEYADFISLFKDVAMTIMSVVGGSSGPLYGTLFMKIGQRLGAKTEVSAEELADALDDGMKGIMTLGKSQAGDKTMIDSIQPAIEAIRANIGEGDVAALDAAVLAASQGMKDTIPMLAKKGRSSYLGERSIGHQDPGATSAYYLIASLRDVIAGS
jgi:dihydroxyacetone kinase-like protein